MFDKTEFYNTVAQLPRQKILEMINEDHPKLLDDDTPSLIEQIERIEAVFKYKMGHLNWADGSPIKSRDMTNFELALLVDPPFDVDPELRRRGLTAEQQYQLYVASDPVIWAREILKQEPRVYQILMLRHPNTRKVLRAGRRLGKALDVETPIPTPDGWKTMGELQIGDQVFDEFGAPCNVTGVTDYQYDRDCYEVSFSDGSSLVADADHQWTVHTKTLRKARNRTKNPQSRTVTLTTREMLDSIYVQCGNKQEVNYSIDVAGPVNYQEKNLEVDPYVFGFWLGDGCSSRGTVCVGLDDQAEVMVRIKECGYGVWNIDSSDTEVHVDGLYRGLNKLGVLKKYEKTNYNKCGGTYPGNDVEKHIPQQYLQGSIHQREELLKGLLDSDGTVDSNGYVELSLTNEGLAKDAYELIQSLGYKATFRVDKAKLYEKYCGFRYRIWFAPNRPVFKLERKLIRQVLRPQPTNRSRVRYITAITPVESRPVKCITVDSENSLYLAGKDFIPTHNSFTMALAMLHYAYTNRNGRVLVMAPMKAQVELLYTEVMRISKESENVSMAITRAVTSPQFKIEFSNGSTISFFTTGLKSGGKCLTPDHDLLTEDGWKPVGDVAVGERIVTWNDGNYEFEEIANTWEYDHDGDIVVHDGKQVSFSVTPNHKFMAKTVDPLSKWRPVEAKDLKTYFIPTGANPIDLPKSWLSNDELELWGWWLAEGSGFIGKMARISQTKIDGRERIIQLAKNLGLHYTTPKAEIRVKWQPPIYSGTNAYNKFIPREIMNTDGISSLLKGLLGGDGWIRKNGWEYSSSSFQLANDVQEVAIRLGLRANIREKNITYTPVGGGSPNPHWIVSAYPYKQSLVNKNNLQKKHYTGKVHCVTVPNSGFFVTRHNGLVHVTGNSDVARGQEANLIILDELDYMGPDDLVAILAMLQKTRGKQDEKTLIGASTPTGLREQFWEWCNSPEFQEFWYPSYCNPFFDEKIEKEMHNLYRDEMAYRHEIEADWGESVDGVYPRKFVDKAFMTGRMLHGPDDDIEDIKASSDWEYNDRKLDNASRFVMGVDWDKFGAGPNICVLEIPPAKIQDVRFKGKVRVIFREEIPRSEFVLNEAVKRIIQLNEVFNPDWIYVDRGFGEVQVENLHLYGIDHPESGLRQKVKGVAFGGSIDVRDPFTQQIDKKKAKIFMVENLRLLLERETIAFPSSDEELYAQLTHYVVSTSSYMGEPRFAMSSSKVLDHAHDALLLACLAFSEHYDELLVVKSSSLVLTASNQALTGVDTRSNKEHQMNVDYADEVKSGTSSIARRSRSMSGRMGTRNRVKRSNF